VPTEIKRCRLGPVGYSLFAANAFWKGNSSVEDVIQKAPVAELQSGGQFTERRQQWLASKRLAPQVFARVLSFTDLARVVQAGHSAAVLPVLAAVDFDSKKFKHEKIGALKPCTLVLIANARSLDRSGIAPAWGRSWRKYPSWGDAGQRQSRGI
jgi:hypothetical protein